jgi:ketosteroid isomerase-like protein
MKTLISSLFAGLSLTALVLPAAEAQERRDIPEYREVGLAQGGQAQAELRAFAAAYRAAWRAEDTQALMAMHVADTEWINAYARLFQDRDSLALFLEHRLFPNFDASVSETEGANMTLIPIRLMGDDAAVLHLYTDGNRGPSVIEGRDLRRTHLHLVLERDENGWKVAHTAIMDARG